MSDTRSPQRDPVPTDRLRTHADPLEAATVRSVEYVSLAPPFDVTYSSWRDCGGTRLSPSTEHRCSLAAWRRWARGATSVHTADRRPIQYMLDREINWLRNQLGPCVVGTTGSTTTAEAGEIVQALLIKMFASPLDLEELRDLIKRVYAWDCSVPRRERTDTTMGEYQEGGS